jgi:uncharacterized protein (TIGR02646 family)
MIYIERGNDLPAIFDDGTVNRKETNIVIEHYKNSTTPYKNYTVYSSPEVKEALIKLFNNKCAYCESIITNHPGEVEHFRPKNQVKDSDKQIEKPGYYWLAADWKNLYLSCIDCNRRRYHAVPEQLKKVMLGKLDQFPLKDKTKRWKNYKDEIERIADEKERLLIDPCKDDPETILGYDDKGLILPLGKEATDVFIKASESIRVFALQRKGLVDERKRYYLFAIKMNLLDIARYKQWLAGSNDAKTIKDMNKAIDEKVAVLKSLIAKDQPYSAMAKYLIKDVLPGLIGKKTMEQVEKIKNS